MKCDTAIRGDLVIGSSTLRGAVVAISEGRVVAICSPGDRLTADEFLDFGDALILPGVIDSHVHSRGEPAEGFTKATRAAAAGGVTTILDMPSDRNRAVVDTDYFAEKVKAGEDECIVDFGLWAAATDENLTAIPALAAAGVVGFKMYMSESQRLGHISDAALFQALEEIARVGSLGAVHAENCDITNHLMKLHREGGDTGPQAFLAARPPFAEVEAVMRATEFALAVGANLHYVHISVADSVQFVASRGNDSDLLSVETCPQYLLLATDALDELGAYAKVSPPLRVAGEQDRLWEHVLAGRVDIVATDHAPHTVEDKTRERIFDNSSGMPGVETLLPLMFSEGVVKRGLKVESLVEMLCSNPARRFGLWPRKGSLMPGFDADLVVVDPSATWEIAANDLHQGSGWTPFEGTHVTGRPVLTMVRGRVVARDGEVFGPAGYGRFQAASRSVPPGAKNSSGRGVGNA